MSNKASFYQDAQTPKDMERWKLREGYPAPWPLERISHMMQDGASYSAEPQEWATGPFRLYDQSGEYMIYEGPSQISGPFCQPSCSSPNRSATTATPTDPTDTNSRGHTNGQLKADWSKAKGSQPRSKETL